LKLNGTHQVLVYADGVNLLDENINIIKKIIEVLLDASKEVGLKVNTRENQVHGYVSSLDCGTKS
jgi:hypothetical protein